MKILIASRCLPAPLWRRGLERLLPGPRPTRARPPGRRSCAPRFDAAAPRAAWRHATYDGFPIAEAVIPVPRQPLGAVCWPATWSRPACCVAWWPRDRRAHAVDLIHAQHALTVPPPSPPRAISAGASGRRIPVVATVRDYWPLAYFSTMQVPARGMDAWARTMDDGRGIAITRGFKIQNPGIVALAGAFWRRGQGVRNIRRCAVLPLWWSGGGAKRRALRRADGGNRRQPVRGRRAAPGACRRSRRGCASSRTWSDLARLDAMIAAPAPLAALGLAAGASVPALLWASWIRARARRCCRTPCARRASGPTCRSCWPVAAPLRPALEAAGRGGGLGPALQPTGWTTTTCCA